MSNLKNWFAVLIVALWVATPSANAADRVLFTLESPPGAAPEPVVLSVLEIPGVQRPGSIKAFRTWTLKPGDRLRLDNQPPDRVVELFSGTALAPSLLCRIAVRYYASSEGWTPNFRLDEEPAVAFVNGRWQPVGGFTGLVQFGNSLPNGDGFFPAIEFGQGSGDLAIVSWQVR